MENIIIVPKFTTCGVVVQRVTPGRGCPENPWDPKYTTLRSACEVLVVRNTNEYNTMNFQTTSTSQALRKVLYLWALEPPRSARALELYVKRRECIRDRFRVSIAIRPMLFKMTYKTYPFLPLTHCSLSHPKQRGINKYLYSTCIYVNIVMSIFKFPHNLFSTIVHGFAR